MYTYEGEGYLFPISVFGGEDGLLNFIGEHDIEATDIDELDNLGVFGDFCSCDICDFATINGIELEIGEGVIVIRKEFDDVAQLAEDAIESFGLLRDLCYGEFYIECEQ